MHHGIAISEVDTLLQKFRKQSAFSEQIGIAGRMHHKGVQ